MKRVLISLCVLFVFACSKTEVPATPPTPVVQKEATQFILLPKITDRIRAIEKLWDAFERIKTFYSFSKPTN
jgi:hypothetical protein